MNGADVVIRNPWRTYRLPVETVAAFHLGPHGRFPSVGLAELEDDRTVPMLGIRGDHPPLGSPDAAQRLIDALNAEHARRTFARPAARP